ncbi:MAG TPA: DUF3488 and transglutaminase-like domain-containing protein [Thermoanaerobaculia bacterium]|jgi:transglutaminase-like putative cysteine protease|nr:DUF3488 and transglutaminase-like domain-containing protein [Thermoanaerobaculia bacterium]
MKFARGKRIALGWLALVAPLPLPFNDVLEWPVFVVYAALVLLFLRRAARDPERWLPIWAMNVIGLAYLPLFYIDLTVLGGGRLVGPVLHLGLFALVVKLFALSKEADKWQAVIGIFFLFLAAMGTSVHPSIMLYLAGFVAVALALLARFAWFHILGQYGRDETELGRVPLGGFLAFATIGALLLAVPFFALMPRIRSPYIVGRGASFGAELEAAGFTDDVTLDSIGQIRNSRGVALRLQWQQGSTPEDPEDMRFKAATHDLFKGASWRRSPPAQAPLSRGRGLRYTLGAAPPIRWATIWLRPLRSTSLPLPVETAVVEPGVLSLRVDQGGAVSLPHPILDTLQYRVGLARQPVLLGEPPPVVGGSTLDTSGVTPRMRALAAQVMGQGSAAERVVRLETHLIQKFDYSTTLLGAGLNGNPLDTFLFETHRGHCELFASSMVLLLRTQGIPARLVTGFLGGEYNPFEGYVIVRDSNAHAWVEAYVGSGPNEGWRIYDPTPPSGRPSADTGGAWRLAQQAYDFMLFRWDRYVLTFGVGDQAEILRRLYSAWSALRNLFSSEKKSESGNSSTEPLAIPTAQQAPAAALTASPLAIAGAALFLLATIALILWLVLRRRPLTPAAAYQRLRLRMGRGGVPLPGSLPPLAVRQLASDRFPNAAAPAARIIDFYVRETYAGEPLEETEQEDLRTALREAEASLRKAG